MVGVPRSQNLIRVKSTAPNQIASLVCPAGVILLVKSASFTSNAAAVSDCFAYVANSDTSVLVVLHREELAADANFNWEGWQVCNPGDQVGCFIGQVDVHAWISGAVLLGEPPIQPVIVTRQLDFVLPLPASPGRAQVQSA